MASAGFELPNGFVNHGAMACEALDALGFEASWGSGHGVSLASPAPAVPPKLGAALDWRSIFGDYTALPEWIGHFEVAIADDGWADVVELWVPRLVPGMATALFHGVIRVGHAVRAIQALRHIGAARRNWHGRSVIGRRVTGLARWWPAAREVDDVQRSGPGRRGRRAARYYLASPSIYFLHGVTGAMAIELLAPHLSGPDQSAALAQLEAEHAAMYAGARPVAEVRVAGAPRRGAGDGGRGQPRPARSQARRGHAAGARPER